MKFFIGLALMLVGIAIGAYFGVWWAFVGGIMQIIDGCKANFATGMIAIGVLKVLCSSIIGWASGSVIFLPGLLMAKTS